MLRDLGGSLWGALVFALPMLAPGYLVAYGINLCNFRSRGAREQLAWSLAVSFGIGTLAIVASAWLAGVWLTGLLLVAAAIAAVSLYLRHRPTNDLSGQDLRRYTAVTLLWTLLVTLSLIDIGFSKQLWMSVTSYDHSVRVAFVGSVMRTGVPPVNPLYWPGHAAPMRYYYFWYVLCAVIARLAHISARQAFIASCVWPLGGVASMLALYGRYLLGWRSAELRRLWWLALGFLCITGLDLLITGLGWLGGGHPPGDLEWWSIAQVSSWADTFLWVPHHAAGLVCGLFTALALWLTSTDEFTASKGKLSILAGISFASCFGLSTYLAIAIAIVLTGWMLWRLFYPDRSRVLISGAIAALTALLVLTPFLIQLFKPTPGGASTAGHVLAFGIRQMLPPKMLLGIPSLTSLYANNPNGATGIAALLLLVPGYFFELGFFFFILIAACRSMVRRSAMPQSRMPQFNGETTLLFWIAMGFVVSSFLRSVVIATNDFAVRATLLPQFGLLLFAAITVQRASLRLRRVLIVCGVLGGLGTVYQVVMLRTYLPWHEAHHDPAMTDLAERNYRLRSAFSDLDAKLPEGARVQYGNTGGYFSYSQMLQANRQIVNADFGCNTSFGGEESACPAIQRASRALFPADSSLTPPAAEALMLCRNLDAQYLVATSGDEVWKSPTGWVWHLPVVVDTPTARVLACGVG